MQSVILAPTDCAAQTELALWEEERKERRKVANNRIGVGEIERVVLWSLEHMGLRRRAHMTCLVTGRERESRAMTAFSVSWTFLDNPTRTRPYHWNWQANCIAMHCNFISLWSIFQHPV